MFKIGNYMGKDRYSFLSDGKNDIGFETKEDAIKFIRDNNIKIVGNNTYIVNMDTMEKFDSVWIRRKVEALKMKNKF